MNKAQRTIILAGVLLIILSFLFPFWTCKFGDQVFTEEYQFILDAPRLGRDNTEPQLHVPYQIDYQRMFAQIAVIVLATFGCALAAKSHNL